MVKSFWRGHEIIETLGGWVYSDTYQVISENLNRTCGHCGKEATKEGHDACLGTLPGVRNACCGHGGTKESYVQFNNGVVIQGFKKLKGENILETKTCCRCKKNKNVTEYHKDKNQKDGLRLRCKLCCKVYNLEHKEERSAYKKERRIKHGDRIRESERKLYRKHISKRKKYRQEHREESLLYGKKYRQEHRKN